MTVAELIEALKAFDPNEEVQICGNIFVEDDGITSVELIDEDVPASKWVKWLKAHHRRYVRIS